MDFTKICRTCLNPGVKMCSLFDKNEPEIELPNSTVALLRIITNIEIFHNDELPDQICIGCFEEINRAYFFKLKCEQSQGILREMKNNRNVNFKEIPIRSRKGDEETKSSDCSDIAQRQSICIKKEIIDDDEFADFDDFSDFDDFTDETLTDQIENPLRNSFKNEECTRENYLEVENKKGRNSSQIKEICIKEDMLENILEDINLSELWQDLKQESESNLTNGKDMPAEDIHRRKRGGLQVKMRQQLAKLYNQLQDPDTSPDEKLQCKQEIRKLRAEKGKWCNERRKRLEERLATRLEERMAAKCKCHMLEKMYRK